MVAAVALFCPYPVPLYVKSVNVEFLFQSDRSNFVGKFSAGMSEYMLIVTICTVVAKYKFYVMIKG